MQWRKNCLFFNSSLFAYPHKPYFIVTLKKERIEIRKKFRATLLGYTQIKISDSVQDHFFSLTPF
ncbi:hypothetical protein CPS_2323 [Colwellia psychrerythraea 34H]|uniref:Uncharacterized protein n=1 Tax=Colwellia psychrerythraea (strain 34H / ATCC BAA-681) TaxID=167879 RepID=Q482H4_COLP3|nr:hypothetical protein CPS_2323 [Colwellia psychrerythraea 34H]